MPCIRPRSRMSPPPTTRRSSIRTPKSGRSSRRAARRSTAPRNSRSRSPAEKKIEEALKQPTQIEFVETPLKDVVDYLKDLHKIEIQLDTAALKEAGVDESTQVTKNIKGISLRSALKLMLDDLQLKYVIHNEVLLITSPAKAESDEYMTTKVYPVADLVLPIKDTGFTGGFGGMGGMGGGMGGMMGGMGMGGMGMGGMGMGAWAWAAWAAWEWVAWGAWEWVAWEAWEWVAWEWAAACSNRRSATIPSLTQPSEAVPGAFFFRRSVWPDQLPGRRAGISADSCGEATA